MLTPDCFQLAKTEPCWVLIDLVAKPKLIVTCLSNGDLMSDLYFTN